VRPNQNETRGSPCETQHSSARLVHWNCWSVEQSGRSKIATGGLEPWDVQHGLLAFSDVVWLLQRYYKSPLFLLPIFGEGIGVATITSEHEKLTRISLKRPLATISATISD
jgi:hypothetical protein